MEKCKVKHCESSLHSKGFCLKHYTRQRRTGSVEARTSLTRFFEKVVKKEDGCWFWSAYKNKAGYGRGRFYGRTLLAHRFSYKAFVGVIPEGLCVLHKCDNPSCVNPGHLFVGTRQDNMDDMVAKGRSGKPKGDEHYNAKLTSTDVLSIRAAKGVQQKVLAKKYGVKQPLISSVILRKSWSHI